MAIFAPFAHPLYVMLKPVGAVCNLACSYCYYLEKSKLYKDEPKHVMNDKLLEKFIEEYINSQTMPQILFTWHGGETLMRPLAFYKRAMELQQKYAHGRTISNCIQTNGTLLTDEWCEFLKKNDWLVGVSIDGPQEFHDRYRRNKQGQPSFVKVMKGIHLLNKYGVDWNAMAVVNNLNADYPLEFYNFFKEIGCRYIQFTPIVERIFRHNDGRLLATIGEDTPELMEFSVTPEQWGNFLCTIFEEWVHNDVGEYYIQLFDATLANWVGENPGICTMGKTCGHAGVMEFNGDVYSCDHFVFPQYKLGNIYSKTLIEMFYGEKQLEFGQNKYRSLPIQFKNCKLTGTSFIETNLKDVLFDHCQGRYSNLSSSQLFNVMFDHCDLQEASFYDANFKKIQFNETNLIQSELASLHHKGLDLSTCQIQGAMFDLASLKGLIINDFQAVDLIGILGVKVK